MNDGQPVFWYYHREHVVMKRIYVLFLCFVFGLIVTDPSYQGAAVGLVTIRR